MYGLELAGDELALRLRNLGHGVAVEVHGAALVGRLREHLGDGADHAGDLIVGEHAHPAQPARLQPGEELPPALGRLSEALGRADDLAVAVVVDAHGYHHRHVLEGVSPGALEVYPVDVDVAVLVLERPVASLLCRLEGLLVEVRDRAGRHARAPDNLADVLDAPRAHAGEVHLHDGLLDRDLAALVALDDRHGEPGTLKFGHRELDAPRGRRKTALVIPGAVGLALGVHEQIGLLVEQGVDRVLDRLAHQLPDAVLYCLLVE